MYPLPSWKLKPSKVAAVVAGGVGGRGGPLAGAAQGRWGGWATSRDRSVLQTWLEKKTVLIISQAQLQKMP